METHCTAIWTVRSVTAFHLLSTLTTLVVLINTSISMLAA